MTDARAAAALPVVVVGAGLAGCAAAAFLSHGGVRVVVVERHDRPAARPRAWIISARSQELFRELGLAGPIAAAGSPGTFDVQLVDSLHEVPAEQPVVDETAEVSPTGAAMCDQDVLEGLLREYAIQHGAQIRWGETVTGLVDDGDLVEVHRGHEPPLLARYVIVAEGARAALPSQIGVAYTRPGGGTFDEFHQVLFRSADLDRKMASRTSKAFFCRAANAIVFRRDLGRWQIQRQGQDCGDLAADIAAAAGQRISVEVLDRFSWRPAAQLAGTFQAGHIFLAGDVAHSMPPSLGMAGNLAIADAHNLAWKLAWVLDGRAGAGLLGSYGSERRPVAELVLHESLAAMKHESALDRATVQLGLGYPPGLSPALCGDRTDLPVVDPHDLTPTIGVRLPHQWLSDGRSTIDLTGINTFAAVGATASTAAALPIHQLPAGVSAADTEHVWILRPDGHVAARVHPADVESALDTILGRTTKG